MKLLPFKLFYNKIIGVYTHVATTKVVRTILIGTVCNYNNNIMVQEKLLISLNKYRDIIEESTKYAHYIHQSKR